MNAKKIFIVAGEASGDTHAAHLIREARDAMPDLRVEGLGGEKMRSAGCELRADLVSMAVMGFVQVFANIRFFHRLMRESVEHIEKSRPDAVVLVDYPGFNMRLASKVKKLGIPVIYYISPQIWAWRPGRIKRIAQIVDKMMVILPFEEKIYLDAGIDATYVGHPLIDSISISEDAPDPDFVAKLDAPDPEALIGLLPGSRKQEITDFLPVLIETAKLIRERMPAATFLIPCSGPGNMETVKEIVGETDLPVKIFLGKIHETAEASRCCIVASGTATLEVGCFSTPLIVVYRTGHVPWLLARAFLQVDHISLVNIIAGKEVVPEMLQSRMRPELLAETAIELCRDGEKREAMIEELGKVRERLGGPGASKRAAEIVLETVVSAGKEPTPQKAQESLAATNG
jgi:lipid-A-disaccharide synthase